MFTRCSTVTIVVNFAAPALEKKDRFNYIKLIAIDFGLLLTKEVISFCTIGSINLDLLLLVTFYLLSITIMLGLFSKFHVYKRMKIERNLSMPST